MIDENKVFCGKCREVDLSECEHDDFCQIQVNDVCVKNTIVDTEIGINNGMNSKDVVSLLIEEIKLIKKELKK